MNDEPQTDLPVTKMAFEKQYSDDSGVAFAVRLDMGDTIGELHFECLDVVKFPLGQINFIRQALDKIARKTDND